MAKICQLFSGSKGNSTFIGGSHGGILIDAGVSAKRLTQRLQELQIDPTCLQGIFLTHEHNDHVSGVRVFASKYHIPVFGTQGTMVALEQQGQLTEKFDAYILDQPALSLGEFTVNRFSTSHDTADSCGYRVELADGTRFGVCTDLGFVSQEVQRSLTGCHGVVLESNHDLTMLKTGPYPTHLKERVAGRRGHLSNDACAELLPTLVQGGTTRIVLAHLSQENNLPLLARRTALGALKAAGMEENKDFILQVASVCGGMPLPL